MKEVEIEQFTVNGPSVRTNNAREIGDAGQIAGLWAQFYASQSTPSKTMFGVYSEYESDASGDFNVTAGTRTETSGGSSVSIMPGTYLAFPAEGAMPAAVFDAWKAVWEYFSKEQPYKRSYKTDFEQYNSPTSATVYIGVRPSCKHQSGT